MRLVNHFAIELIHHPVEVASGFMLHQASSDSRSSTFWIVQENKSLGITDNHVLLSESWLAEVSRSYTAK